MADAKRLDDREGDEGPQPFLVRPSTSGRDDVASRPRGGLGPHPLRGTKPTGHSPSAPGAEDLPDLGGFAEETEWRGRNVRGAARALPAAAPRPPAEPVVADRPADVPAATPPRRDPVAAPAAALSLEDLIDSLPSAEARVPSPVPAPATAAADDVSRSRAPSPSPTEEARPSASVAARPEAVIVPRRTEAAAEAIPPAAGRVRPEIPPSNQGSRRPPPPRRPKAATEAGPREAPLRPREGAIVVPQYVGKAPQAPGKAPQAPVKAAQAQDKPVPRQEAVPEGPPSRGPTQALLPSPEPRALTPVVAGVPTPVAARAPDRDAADVDVGRFQIGAVTRETSEVPGGDGAEAPAWASLPGTLRRHPRRYAAAAVLACVVLAYASLPSRRSDSVTDTDTGTDARATGATDGAAKPFRNAVAAPTEVARPREVGMPKDVGKAASVPLDSARIVAPADPRASRVPAVADDKATGGNAAPRVASRPTSPFAFPPIAPLPSRASGASDNGHIGPPVEAQAARPTAPTGSRDVAVAAPSAAATRAAPSGPDDLGALAMPGGASPVNRATAPVTAAVAPADTRPTPAAGPWDVPADAGDRRSSYRPEPPASAPPVAPPSKAKAVEAVSPPPRPRLAAVSEGRAAARKRRDDVAHGGRSDPVFRHGGSDAAPSLPGILRPGGA